MINVYVTVSTTYTQVNGTKSPSFPRNEVDLVPLACKDVSTSANRQGVAILDIIHLTNLELGREFDKLVHNTCT